MHQQVRTSPTPTGTGPGAMSASEGAGLVELLTILRDGGFNLQLAGGHDLDATGELVFAIYHDEHDPDRPNRDAARLLKEHNYAARVVRAHHCDVANEPGGLLGCLERIQKEDGAIAEIYVGVGDQNNVPIQIVTRRGLEEEADLAAS